MSALLDFFNCLCEPVVKKGAASNTKRRERFRESSSIAREILFDDDISRERHEKNVVVGVNVVQEALDGGRCRTHLAGHAAAGIEQNSDAYRYITILREMRDLLGDTVFQDSEVFGLEIGDKLALR